MDKPGYRIVDIQTLQFATFETSYRPEIEELNVTSAYSYGVDSSSRLFICAMSVSFFQEGNIIVKIDSQVVFQFNESAFNSFVSDNKFIMDEKAVGHFTSILYGATRGILASKLEETSLRKIILPPVELDQLIDRPLEITLE